MEQRLETALMSLIEDYIQTAEPVSSSALVERHKLHVSSATIRNWFVLLEQEGYLVQPHTSAGRIPSEMAYEWYIRQTGLIPLSATEKGTIRKANEESEDPASRAKGLAKAITALTNNASLVGSNTSDTYYTGLTSLFSHPEFQDWSRVISMSTVLDRLDYQLNQLRKQSYKEPTVLLGSACPFGNACGSILLSVFGDSLLVVLGPIRMDYKKARSVLSFVAEITS